MSLADPPPRYAATPDAMTNPHTKSAPESRGQLRIVAQPLWWRIVVVCVVCAGLGAWSPIIAGESHPPVAGAPPSTDAQPLAEPPDGVDLRHALARTVIERNTMVQQVDTLESQRWLIIGYGVVITLLAGWLVHLQLLRTKPVGTGPFADQDGDEALTRATAVITVRNPETQREVVTGRVTTHHRLGVQTTRMMPVARRAVPRPITPPAGSPARATTVVARKKIIPAKAAPESTPAPAETPGPETTEYTPSNSANPSAKTGTARPLIVDEFADLDALADSPVEDGTHTRLMRKNQTLARPPSNSRSGLSLLEIMISLAILATVLASVSGGIFTLTSSRQAMDEDLAVSDVMRLWSERLMGADWDWLGRERFDDPLQGAWSWQRPEIDATELLPGDHLPMSEAVPIGTGNTATLLLSGTTSGVSELQLFLEYYRPAVMDACLATPAGSEEDLWALNRSVYRLTPPIDLRQQHQAVVIRLSAHWRTQGGGKRQSELLFARRK